MFLQANSNRFHHLGCFLCNQLNIVLLALNVFFVSVVIGGNLLAPGIYFPVVSGGGLLLTFVFGRFLFKEKYENSQYVGLFFGLIAVVLLNL